MTFKSQRGSIAMWAWSLSLGLHIVLLAIFGIIKFSQISSSAEISIPAKAYIRAIKRLAECPQIIPKPKTRKLSDSRSLNKVPMDFPTRPKLRPPNHSEGSAKISSSRSAAMLPGSTVGAGTTEFFGQQTDMRKICYVVDCSGSMQGLFSRVRKELKKTIANLQADRYFYIIFFCGDRLLESGHGRMVRASSRAKSEAYAFLNSAKPAGPTNAINALKRGMEIKGPGGRPPGLIYFLTDGFDLETGQRSQFTLELENLRKNLAPGSIINTIGFWTEVSDCEILRIIARQSGGEFVNIK